MHTPHSAVCANAVHRDWDAGILVASERRFRRLAEALTDYIYSVRIENGRPVETSHGARCVAVTGYSAEEFASNPHLWFEMVHEDDRGQVREQAQQLLAGHEREPIEHRLCHKDGGLRWVRNTAVLQYDARGQFIGYDGLVQDITERRRAEEEWHRSAAALQAANRVLEEQKAQIEAQRLDLLNTNQELERSKCAADAANRAKSEFLANMSHEIRTPMTAIVGFADNLLDSSISASDRLSAAQTIRRNGKHLLQLINDILDLSKIEAGKLELESLRCSPVQLLADVQSLMQVRTDAKQLTLNFEFGGPIPETIETDPTRLRQILANLVGNAIKFTESGGVRVVTRLVDGPRLRFDVMDTGIGLTPQQVQGLFQPFAQADSSTTRRFGGTGLGLLISQRLAASLGGTIVVDSQAGVGSTFTVTVATGSLDDVPMLDDPGAAMLTTPTSTAAAPVPDPPLGGRLLLVEDGPDSQRLIAYLLRKVGAEVTVVENGRLAVEAALAAQESGRPFDVILMDMQMPVMDGYEASALLRARGYRRPIVALTAHAMASDRAKCLAAGCDDYATKPIDRQNLIATVRTHLQPRAALATGPAAGSGDPPPAWAQTTEACAWRGLAP